MIKAAIVHQLEIKHWDNDKILW